MDFENHVFWQADWSLRNFTYYSPSLPDDETRVLLEDLGSDKLFFENPALLMVRNARGACHPHLEAVELPPQGGEVDAFAPLKLSTGDRYKGLAI